MSRKPQEWVVLAAAHTQLRLQLRGHDSGESFIAWACQILGQSLPDGPAERRALDNRLSEMLNELNEELL